MFWIPHDTFINYENNYKNYQNRKSSYVSIRVGSACVRVYELVLRSKTNWCSPAVSPWPDSCSDKQVTSFPGGETGRERWKSSVPFYSYQLSRLMRLDWTIGINQVGTVSETRVTNKVPTVQAANLPEAFY